MTQPDFDELARLWTQEQSPEEERILRSLVRRAGWQAKALQYAEVGMCVLLVIAVLVALFVNAQPATLIVGGLTIVAIMWSTWKRRHRQEAMLIDAGDREKMLESAVRNGRASLKRSALGLTLLVPGFLLGTLLKYLIQSGGQIDGYLRALAASVTRPGWGMTGAILIALLLAYLARSHVRMRREVARLEQLRLEYRDEAQLDHQS